MFRAFCSEIIGYLFKRSFTVLLIPEDKLIYAPDLNDGSVMAQCLEVYLDLAAMHICVKNEGSVKKT